MRTERPLLLVLVLSIQMTTAVAASPGPAYQVADIAENTPVGSQGGLVYPGYFQPVADGDVFIAPAGTGAPSLWRTDGTPEGTRPVIAGGSFGIGAPIGSNGQVAFFWSVAGDNTKSFWATDGTESGTVRLKDGIVAPYAPGFFDSDPRVVDGRLFFHHGTPPPYTACELWTSDGTVEGTRKLADLARRATGLSGSDGQFYFLATPAEGPDFLLWRTDGSAEGTAPLREFANEGPSFETASIDGQALVAAEGKLWITDADSVDLVATLDSDEYVSFFEATVEGDALQFFAHPLNGGTDLTVWRSDGTLNGTSPVLNSTVHAAALTPYPWVQRLDSRLYYLVPAPNGREPYTLWSSDADGEGAEPMSCGGCSSIPEPGWIVVADEKLYFPAAEGEVHTLWKVDSSHTAQPVESYCTGYCRTESAVALEDRAMFVVYPAPGSGELWTTDGSSGGTRSVGSFDSLFYLYASASLDGALFSAAIDSAYATGLWLSRGAPEDTVQLSPVVGQGSQLRELRRAGERVAFLACTGPSGAWGAGAHEAELVKEGYVDCTSTSAFYPFVSAGGSAFFGFSESGQAELWATDGTADSTRKVWEGGFDDAGTVHDMVEWNSGLAFWASRLVASQRITGFWLSDGTAEGTSGLFELPLDAAPPIGSTVLGDEIYFRSQSPDLQIWRSMGTEGSTVRLTEEPAGEFVWDPEFTRVGPFVFFTGRQGLWRTDGTPEGTTLLIPGPVDESPYCSDRLSFLHELGGSLLFQRYENNLSTLWRTEGSSATAQQIAEFRTIESIPRSAASLGGYLYFAADDGVHGVELWRTDGTAAGTVLVRDIGEGPSSGNPRELVAADGKLYFTAEEMFSGSELWVSDGTTGGTRQVQEIAPFAASSAPADLTVVGDLLYFSAGDASTGRELWALPLAGQPTACIPSAEQLCLNAGKFRIEVSWRDFTGNTGSGYALSLSDDTGYFWFFDESIVELVVKVLDGRGINDHYWVYYASLSNVEFDVTITDTETNEFRIYHNPSGTFASVGDIEAFPTGEPGIGPADRPATEPLLPHTATEPLGTCAPSSTRLCLQGGRFAVEAEWTDFAGNSGAGVAVPMSADTGYFWFFSPSVVEVVAKVVDGRLVNGKFWVFYGALSNVEYTLTVTDTVTGAVQPYHNPSGQFASVGDIEPF